MAVKTFTAVKTKTLYEINTPIEIGGRKTVLLTKMTFDEKKGTFDSKQGFTTKHLSGLKATKDEVLGAIAKVNQQAYDFGVHLVQQKLLEERGDLGQEDQADLFSFVNQKLPEKIEEAKIDEEEEGSAAPSEAVPPIKKGRKKAEKKVEKVS